MKEQHETGRVMFSGKSNQGVGIRVLRGSTRDDVDSVLQTHPWGKDGPRDVSEIYEWNVQLGRCIGRVEGPPPGTVAGR